MRFSQGQKLIDFLRGKNSSSSDVKSIMNKITKELVNNGYKINEEENIIITPNNVKFYDNSSLYAIFEDFYKKEYGIILNDNSIFIDVGLNTATTSLYFATMENIKQIYAFEPFIPNGKCLAIFSLAVSLDFKSSVRATKFVYLNWFAIGFVNILFILKNYLVVI